MSNKTCGTCARVVEPWKQQKKSCLSCVHQTHEKCMMRGSTEPCKRYSTRSSVCFTGRFSYCVLPDDVEGVIRERNVRENQQACHNYLARKTCRTCDHAGSGWDMHPEECRTCAHDKGIGEKCGRSEQSFLKKCGREKCSEYERSDSKEYGACWLDCSRFAIVTADHVCEHFTPASDICAPYSKESADRELVIEQEIEEEPIDPLTFNHEKEHVLTDKTCDDCLCCRPDPKRPSIRRIIMPVTHEDGTSHEWGMCAYPLHGELQGGGTVHRGQPACRHFVQAPPEQLELAL